MSPPTPRVVCPACARARLEQADDVEFQLAYAPARAPDDGDDEVLLIAATDPPRNRVPGARKQPCADCGVPVNVSPSSDWLLGR